MLKWEPPGPDVRWSDVLSAEQARRNASKRTLRAALFALEMLLVQTRPHCHQKEPRGLQQNDRELFWGSWEDRMSSANAY